jgi:hypothetical protein
MRGLLSNTTKRAWRTAFACALASCGLARSDDPTPPTPAGPNCAPPDLSSVYRDAYLNPSVVGPPGGLAHGGAEAGPADRPLGGIWTNPKRWKLYGGADYIRWQRSGIPRIVLTSVSRNLFWDDPEQQNLGALNAENSTTGARTIGVNPSAQIFPAKVFPGPGLPGELYTPNDPDVRVNVTDFLIAGAERMTTDMFDVGRVRSGFRPKIGIEFPNGDRFDVSYFVVEDTQPAALVDNVTGSAFLTKQISSGIAGPVRFGVFRWGYLDAPFQLTGGATVESQQLLIDFRGEDVRRFVGPGLTPDFPHFPWNELPQPTVLTDPASPLLPIFDPQGPPGFLGNGDPNGVRSADIPREPTSNDFPGQSFLFQDGELAVATFRSDLQGGEAVYRRKCREWNRSWYDMDLLFALKWVNMNERFTFFFADLYNFSRTTAAGIPFPNGGVTLTPNVPQPPAFVPNDFGLLDPPDARGQAAEDTQITIDRKISNNLFGPQFGADIRIPFRTYFEVQMASKIGFVLNAMETSALNFRGDGLILSDYSKSNILTSGIWDGQLGLNYFPHPNVRLGLGFEWMCLMRVGGAFSNQALDLSVENRPRNNDSILWAGWYAGGEFNF